MLSAERIALLRHGAPPRNALEAALRNAWSGGGASYEKTVGPAPIISISDAKAKPAKSLIVGMEPIQDLHGYDSPWPAGGGKNLYNSSTFPTVTRNGVTCTNNGDGSFTLNGTANADIYFDIFTNQYKESIGGIPLPQGSYRITGCPTGGSVQTYYMYATPSYTGDYGNGGTIINNIVTGGSIFVKSGFICNNLVFRPMIRVSTNGDDTWQPYSNECPISGRTGVTAEQVGKNIAETALKIYTANGITVDINPDGTLRWHGTVESVETITPLRMSLHLFKLSDFNIKAGDSVVFWCENGGMQFVEANANGDVVGGEHYFPTIDPEAGDHSTYTIQSSDNYFFCAYYVGDISYENGDVIDVTAKYYCAVGSTRTGWKPYQKMTYPVAIPDSVGTVYGGTVDVVSGLLTVTDAEIASYNGETLPSKWISDRDVYAEGTTPTIGAQVVYELATPQTYQLTPTQIQLLKGSNTLWSDADDLTLTYIGTTPANLLGGMLGGGLGNPQEPTEETSEEPTEGDGE